MIKIRMGSIANILMGMGRVFAATHTEGLQASVNDGG